MGNNRRRVPERKRSFRVSTDKGFFNNAVLAIIILYFYLRCYITSRLELQGSAFLFACYDFVMLFVILFSYPLKNVIASLVRKKFKLQQYNNGKRIIYGGFIVSIIYSGVVIGLLYMTKDAICEHFLLGQGSELAFICMVPIIITAALAAVYKGYFIATRSMGLLIINELVEKIAMIVGVIIFSGAFGKYGAKVSAVLFTEEYQYAFGAAGASIGICAGSLLGCITSGILFRFNNGRFRQDATRKKDDIYDIMSWIRTELLVAAIPLCFPLMAHIFEQVFFFKQSEDAVSNSLTLYQWGAYNGVYRNVLLFVLIIIFAFSTLNKKELSKGIRDGNLQEVRIKVTEMVRSTFLISLPFSGFFLAVAKPLCTGVFLISSDLCVRIIRFGALAIVIMALGITLMNVLSAIGRTMVCLFNGVMAFALNILACILFVGVWDMGIYGILIGFYVFSLAFAGLNYFFVRNYLKFNPKFLEQFLAPFLVTLAAGVITFLLSLLFALFLPSMAQVIISFVIYMLIIFVGLVKFGMLNSYSLSKAPLAGVWLMLGRLFHLFK